MKPKTMALLLVAIGCGVLAAVGSTLLGPGAKQVEMVDILIAKEKIDNGTPIKDPNALFKTKSIAKDSKLKGQIENTTIMKEKIKDKVVMREIPAGEPITERDLSDTAGPPLKENERGYAIRVDLEKTAGGFVRPKSRVDVISVQKRGGRVIVKPILQNMEVIAVNQLLDQPTKNQSLVPSTVTFKVTPAETLILAAHKDSTQLSLALRGQQDGKVVSVEPYEEVEEVEILVANLDIDSNTELSEPQAYFVKKSVPGNEEIAGAIHDFQILQGRTLKNPISKGKPVTFKDLKPMAVVKAPTETPTTLPEETPLPPVKREFTMIISNGPTTTPFTFQEKDDPLLQPKKPVVGGSDGK